MRALFYPSRPQLGYHNGLASEPSKFERRLFLALAGVALVYSFLAGLATVGDPDFGWQLARGRWIAQHHQVFSSDVLSYTIRGADAIYPPLGGLILYGIYVLGGYQLLSWVCAVACAGIVALLLRRGNAVSAAIAILVVPFIALRTVPRAELFAIVIFATFVSVLWQHYETGRAPLWLLPLLMAVWVNVHFSFFSGFGLLAAFVVVELLEWPFGSDRRLQSIRRLKREIPWFLATAAATIANPWGWRIYKETTQYTEAALGIDVNEWAPLHWNWTNPFISFSLRNTNDLAHVIFVIVVLAVVVALWQRRLGAAFLLLAALFEVTRHLRYMALSSCLLVVVAGAVLFAALPFVRSRITSPRTRLILASATIVIFVSIAIVRAADVVTNYHYLAEPTLSTFGGGLSTRFPLRAAEFIQDQNLPGEVFNTYNEGGFTLWQLGPQRRDYVDGREIPFGAAFLKHEADLRRTPLDSETWRHEADRYGINTIIFPLALDEISLERVNDDCHSKQWRPVYLDEVAIVLVRRSAATEDLIRRFEVDCAIAPLPRAPLPQNAPSFSQWINAARVLSRLGRNFEALRAADKAMTIFGANAHAHWYRGQILYALQRQSEAEEEWKRALALAPREVGPWSRLHDFQADVWSSLADLYRRQDRAAEAMHALETVVKLSSDPSLKLQTRAKLGVLYLADGRDSDAEQQWLAALSLAPKDAPIWLSLADLYERGKRFPQAIHAAQQAILSAPDPATKSHALVKLALLYLRTRQPQQTLEALDQATATAPPDLLAATGRSSFTFDIAQARAAAWMALGNIGQATSFEEQAVKLNPDAVDAWMHLAKLYQREGRVADQQLAERRASALQSVSTQY